MPKAHRGRIVDVEQTPAGQAVVLRTEGEYRSFVLDDGSPPAALGALVSIEADEHGATIAESWGPSRGRWDSAGDGLRWSKPGCTARADNLRLRQEIIRAIREDLYSQGFLEFETPLAVHGTCPDAEIRSVETTEGAYLVTSTEYQLKRLVVGGFDRVFSLTKNFRAGDRGRFHSSEFTMLEWARSWKTLSDIEDDAERFTRRAFRVIQPAASTIRVNGHEVELDGRPWERVTLRAALTRHLLVEVDDTFSLTSMVQGADRGGVRLPESFREDRHLVISFLLDELQQYLGHPLPAFLREWPTFMTSSAPPQSGSAGLAERSELYIAGIEVSDGFPFLRDAAVQRTNFNRENQRRVELGRPPVRLDERYLQALEQGLPPGAGMALGIDRLVAVLVGAEDLAEVQPFSSAEL